MSWVEKTGEGEAGGGEEAECDGRWIGKEDGVSWVSGYGQSGVDQLSGFGGAFREVLILFMDVQPTSALIMSEYEDGCLAVSPGVHSIDTLSLMDVETGFAMNLR